MKKSILYVSALFGCFFILLAIYCISLNNDAKQIKDGVLRFHIVANSNTANDQQLKLKVRDGIADYCSELFGGLNNKTQAVDIANKNLENLKQKAELILKQNGCENAVSVCVTERYFPTKDYEGVSLPAGVYDTLDIKIGSAEGENFWCVMFPDICISSSSAKTNKQKLSTVLSGDSLKIATNNKSCRVRFKFKTIELIESVKNKIKDK